jgi:uncharacterized protein YndB with AHSA1/START domain
VPDEISDTNGERTIHLEREYAASAGELWQAWTDPVRLARWLGPPTGPLLDTIGPVRLRLGDDPDQWADVRVLRAEEPRLLELAWDFPGQSGSVLRIEIAAAAAGRTRLIIDHRGLGSSSTGYGAGWQAYLDGSLRAEIGIAAAESWDTLFARALPAWQQRAANLA